MADGASGGGAGGGGGDKQKRRGKYLAAQASKRKRQTAIPHGCQGFLITCDGGRESQCARETINLLDEFLEKHREGSDSEKKDDGSNGFEKSDDKSSGDAEENKGTQKPVNEKNIDQLMQAELEELRDKKKAQFRNVDTGCNGIVFIEMLKGDTVGPTELGESIVRTVASTKKSKTRFSLKLLPVELTCYASPEEVIKAAKEVILRHFPPDSSEPGLKFAVVYEARSNTGIERTAMIDAVARLVPKPHSVYLKNPNKTIMVQVVKTTCTIGILSGFKELSKYNLRELGSSKTSKDKAEN